MLRTGRLIFFAPTTIATLLGLAGVGFGDSNILPPVSVDGDATVKTSKSYKFCCAAVREVNDVREDRFFAELLIESRGHKLAPADITVTIQSHTGAINVPVSRDGAIQNFPISGDLLAENPLVVANQPKGSLELGLQIRIPVPNQKRFKYSDLVAGVKEANHLVRKATGILGMFAP